MKTHHRIASYWGGGLKEFPEKLGTPENSDEDKLLAELIPEIQSIYKTLYDHHVYSLKLEESLKQSESRINEFQDGFQAQTMNDLESRCRSLEDGSTEIMDAFRDLEKEYKSLESAYRAVEDVAHRRLITLRNLEMTLGNLEHQIKKSKRLDDFQQQTLKPLTTMLSAANQRITELELQIVKLRQQPSNKSTENRDLE